MDPKDKEIFRDFYYKYHSIILINELNEIKQEERASKETINIVAAMYDCKGTQSTLKDEEVPKMPGTSVDKIKSTRAQEKKPVTKVDRTKINQRNTNGRSIKKQLPKGKQPHFPPTCEKEEKCVVEKPGTDLTSTKSRQRNINGRQIKNQLSKGKQSHIRLTCKKEEKCIVEKPVTNLVRTRSHQRNTNRRPITTQLSKAKQSHFSLTCKKEEKSIVKKSGTDLKRTRSQQRNTYGRPVKSQLPKRKQSHCRRTCEKSNPAVSMVKSRTQSVSKIKGVSNYQDHTVEMSIPDTNEMRSVDGAIFTESPTHEIKDETSKLDVDKYQEQPTISSSLQNPEAQVKTNEIEKEESIKEKSNAEKIAPFKPRNTLKEVNDDLMKMFDVDQLLINLGVQRTSKVSLCLKAAIFNGHIDIKGNSLGMKTVILEIIDENFCPCGRKFTATLENVLYQPDTAGYDREELNLATVRCDCASRCSNRDCDINSLFPSPHAIYVTNICNGKPSVTTGHYHNHCDECPNFGICIGDYRESHCLNCHEHFFKIGTDGLCTNCNK